MKHVLHQKGIELIDVLKALGLGWCNCSNVGFESGAGRSVWQDVLGTCEKECRKAMPERVLRRLSRTSLSLLHAPALVLSVFGFLEALIDAGQDTVYLSTADQGGAFHSEDGV